MTTQLDPNRTLCFVGGHEGAGTIGLLGLADTTRLWEMGQEQEFRALMAAREGVAPETLENCVGFRLAHHDHPLETRHCGMIPESIRTNITRWLGYTPKSMVGRTNMGAQLSLLAGTEFLAGLDIQNMSEICESPGDLAVYASSAMPATDIVTRGMRMTGQRLPEEVIKAINELMAGRTEDSFIAAHKILTDLLENPVVGRDSFLQRHGRGPEITMMANVLGSTISTIFSNAIGSPTRPMAAEVRLTAECATFLGSVRMAAHNLLADRELQPAKAILVGASEAGFGIPEAVLVLALFRSMMAVEATDNALVRGSLWNAYAPMSPVAKGFWASEAAMMSCIMTVPEAVRRGLPILAYLIAIGASADEGQKKNPAAIGSGFKPALEHVMNIAREKGVAPRYVSLHCPGTENGLEIEPGTLREVFGDYGLDLGGIQLVADRAINGHPFSVAAAMGVASMLRGFAAGLLPGARNINRFGIHSVFEGFKVTEEPAQVDPDALYLLNALGFWGNDYVLGVQPHVFGQGRLARRFGISPAAEAVYERAAQDRLARGQSKLASLRAGALTRRAYLEAIHYT